MSSDYIIHHALSGLDALRLGHLPLLPSQAIVDEPSSFRKFGCWLPNLCVFKPSWLGFPSIVVQSSKGLPALQRDTLQSFQLQRTMYVKHNLSIPCCSYLSLADSALRLLTLSHESWLYLFLPRWRRLSHVVDEPFSIRDLAADCPILMILKPSHLAVSCLRCGSWGSKGFPAIKGIYSDLIYRESRSCKNFSVLQHPTYRTSSHRKPSGNSSCRAERYT